jgi:hypothetical protein
MNRIFVLVTFISILVLGTTTFQNSIAQNSKTTCCVQTGGIVRTQADQQQYCAGSADGQKAANDNFQRHAQFNNSPPPQTQGLNHTAAYNEGYKNSYTDEWTILTKG